LIGYVEPNLPNLLFERSIDSDDTDESESRRRFLEEERNQTLRETTSDSISTISASPERKRMSRRLSRVYFTNRLSSWTTRMRVSSKIPAAEAASKAASLSSAVATAARAPKATNQSATQSISESPVGRPSSISANEFRRFSTSSAYVVTHHPPVPRQNYLR
jgi:hypothetical protein